MSSFVATTSQTTISSETMEVWIRKKNVSNEWVI